MSSTNYIRLFARTWKLTLFATLLGAILAVGFSLIQPLRYSSTIRLLITQTNVVGVDPYTAIASTERIATSLSQLIQTSSFYNAVMSKGTVNASYFPTDEINKRKKWADAIETNVISGTGIMSVTAYHTDRTQATNLAVAVAQELVDIAPNYFGYSVRVQIIDDPLQSRFYAKPDFLKNGLIGAIAGLLLGTAWVLGKVRNPA